MSNLQLGWCSGYMGLQYHYDEACEEKKIDKSISSCNPPFAIFSRKYYNEIKFLSNVKEIDYCFIGSINSCKDKRMWVIDFAKKYFTDKSVFINTDFGNWISIGPFDLTHLNKGFAPKNHPSNQSKEAQFRKIDENKFYFETMKKSKFSLCPAGDSLWSFRFYEILMCGSIPIVESWHHTYRTREESILTYSYYLNEPQSNHIYNEEMINNNYKIFEENHLLR